MKYTSALAVPVMLEAIGCERSSMGDKIFFTPQVIRKRFRDPETAMIGDVPLSKYLFDMQKGALVIWWGEGSLHVTAHGNDVPFQRIDMILHTAAAICEELVAKWEELIQTYLGENDE